MSESRPLPAAPEPGRRSTIRQIASVAALLGGLFFGGLAVGVAIAVTLGGGSAGAILVGFVTLPLAFGLALGAWRALLGAWVIAALAKSALRSGGDEERFRDEMVGALGGIRAGGPVVLPGAWVFIPITLGVGGGGGGPDGARRRGEWGGSGRAATGGERGPWHPDAAPGPLGTAADPGGVKAGPGMVRPRRSTPARGALKSSRCLEHSPAGAEAQRQRRSTPERPLEPQ